MFGISCDFELLFMRTADAMQPAQTLDTIQPSLLALREQLTLDLLSAVDAAATLMRGFDGNDQAHVFEFTR